MTRILLEPRSLVLVQDDMYNTYLHGIEERMTDDVTGEIANLRQCNIPVGEQLDRQTRISLTIRHVPKVLRAQIRLGRK